MIGAGTAGQSQEMPPPPTGRGLRCGLVRISSESSFKWAYTLALAKQLMITRKKVSIKKGGFWKKTLWIFVSLIWAINLQMEALHGFARIGHGGFLDTYKWIDFPPRVRKPNQSFAQGCLDSLSIITCILSTYDTSFS